MAEEIAREHVLNVRRQDRNFLLRIRAREFMYDDLVWQAEEKISLIDELFKKSDLHEAPDFTMAETLLIKIREAFY